MKFEVSAIEPVIVDAGPELLSHNLMSPFVWAPRSTSRLSLMLRAVPPHHQSDEESGRLWFGTADEAGLCFQMDDAPAIKPGPDAIDALGCEDPTIVEVDDGYVAYYTAIQKGGEAQLAYAQGPDIRALTKCGVALKSKKSERSTKEATVERTADGEWRLLHEYSKEGHSRIGLAIGKSAGGPWDEKDDPFTARPDCWDSWHLSTGPLIRRGSSAPIMFYNGADKDADWGIGWAVLSSNLSHATARSEEALIAPPGGSASGRDISFAASAVDRGETIWLYFSRNDRQLFRAAIHQL